MTFSIWFPFLVKGSSLTLGKSPESWTLLGKEVLLHKSSSCEDRYALAASGFSSVAEAEHFIFKLNGVLGIFALNKGISIDTALQSEIKTLIIESTQDSSSVFSIAESEQLYVNIDYFQTRIYPDILSTKDGGIISGKYKSVFSQKILYDEINSLSLDGFDFKAVCEDRKLQQALRMYFLGLSAESDVLRFICCVNTVETFIEEKEIEGFDNSELGKLVAATISYLDSLKEKGNEQKSELLGSIKSVIKRLKKDSISEGFVRAIKESGLDVDENTLKDIYDLRSKIVHTGSTDCHAERLHYLFSETDRIVSHFIRSKYLAKIKSNKG